MARFLGLARHDQPRLFAAAWAIHKPPVLLHFKLDVHAALLAGAFGEHIFYLKLSVVRLYVSTHKREACSMDGKLFDELRAMSPEKRRHEIIEIMETLMFFCDESCPLNSAQRCPLAQTCRCQQQN